MDGGCDSGFSHVEPTKYEPRLFVVKKTGRRTEVRQIQMRRNLVNSGDVFIMDLGLKIYQWNGNSCSKVIVIKMKQDLSYRGCSSLRSAQDWVCRCK